MNQNRIVTILLVLTSLLGCSASSDPKAASKENFAKAINDYLPQTDLACFSPGFRSTSFPKAYSADEKDAVAHMNSLVSAGLLKSTEGMVQEHGIGLGKPKTIPGYKYELSDIGRSAQKQSGYDYDGAQYKFCFGTPKVIEITNYTEPADMLGLKVSEVNFTYKVTGEAQWSHSAEVQSSYPQVAMALNDAQKSKTTLRLTANGWIDDKLAKEK